MYADTESDVSYSQIKWRHFLHTVIANFVSHVYILHVKLIFYMYLRTVYFLGSTLVIVKTLRDPIYLNLNTEMVIK